MKINSISKSKLNVFERCPLWAYNSLRSNKPFVKNDLAQIGTAAHALAAEAVSKEFGRDYSAKMLLEDIPSPLISEAVKIVQRNNFFKIFEGLDLIEVEKSFSLKMDIEGKEILFNGIWDSVSILEDRAIVIHEWKTSFNIKKETDTEALLYALAAYREYQLPVYFIRRSLTVRDSFEEFFSMQQLEMLEEFIIRDIADYISQMEDENILPEHRPGGHCEYCPYLHKCQGRKIVNTIPNKVKATIISKAYAKVNESYVKEYAKEKLSAMEEAGEINPADSNININISGGYGVGLSISRSWGIKGRKVTKKEIIKRLFEDDLLEEYIDLIDIKFNEDLCKTIEDSYNVPCKETAKRSLVILKNED